MCSFWYFTNLLAYKRCEYELNVQLNELKCVALKPLILLLNGNDGNQQLRINLFGLTHLI